MTEFRLDIHHTFHLSSDITILLQRIENKMATFVEQLTVALTSANAHMDTLTAAVANTGAEMNGLSAIIADLRNQLQNATGLTPTEQQSMLDLTQQADAKIVAATQALVTTDQTNAPA